MNSIVLAPLHLSKRVLSVRNPQSLYSRWCGLLLVFFTKIRCGGHPLVVATNLEFPVRFRCATVHRFDPVFLVFHSVTPVRIHVTWTFGHLVVIAVWKAVVDTPRHMDYSTDRRDTLS